MGVVCATQSQVAARTECCLQPPLKELEVISVENCDDVPFTASEYCLICQSLQEVNHIVSADALVNISALSRRCRLSSQQRHDDLDHLVFQVFTSNDEEENPIAPHGVSYVEVAQLSSLDKLLSQGIAKRFPKYFAPSMHVNQFCQKSDYGAFVSVSERAKLGGFSSIEEFQRVVKEASQSVSVILQPYVCVVAETVATFKKESGGGELDDLAATVVAALSTTFPSNPGVRVRCCSGLLKQLFLVGGGNGSLYADDCEEEGRCDDLVLADMLRVDSINTLLYSLTRAVGFDGFKGMHSAAEVQEWARVLHHSLRWMGVVSGVDIDGEPLQQWWPRFVEQLPLHVLGVSARQSIYYLHCCAMGQQKLVLPAVLRSDALASVSKLLASRGLDSLADQSFRMFPVFATEGVGLESGEGHGPRKELFDLCAAESHALRSAAIDISSSASLQMVSSMKEVSAQRMATGSRVPNSFTGKPVLLLSWKQKRIVAHFAPGDVLLVTLERKQHSGGSDVRHELSPAVRNECWMVEGTVDSSSATESIVVLSTLSARIPFEFRVAACKVEVRRTPPFRLDAGNQHCWLNPSLARGTPSSTLMFSVGFLLANSVANGVCFAAPFPPLLFRILRHRLLHPTVKYAVHPSDLTLLNTALVDAVKQTEGMSESEWRGVAEAEGLPPTTSRKEYIDAVAKEYIFNAVDELASRELLSMLIKGFATSPAATCPVTSQSSSRQLRSMFCGALDDGTGDFSFDEQFRFIEEPEAFRFPQNRKFREIVTRVFENDLDAANKRLLLKFITGRTLLPSRPKAEHIKIEFPFAPMVAAGFDKSLERLPSSHSCDNVIELVNTLESLLFASQSAYYARSGTRIGGVILDSHKESAWSLFSADEQRALTDEAHRLLRSKLVAAITLSGTYELDEGAVSKAARDAFDETHVGRIQLPAAPSSAAHRAPLAGESPPPRGSNGRLEQQQPPTPAQASSKPFAFVQRASMLYDDEFEEPTEVEPPGSTGRDGAASGVLFKRGFSAGGSHTTATSGERVRASDNPFSSHSRGHAALGIFAANDLRDDDDTVVISDACDQGQTSAPQKVPTRRAEDLDELMTELFPAK